MTSKYRTNGEHIKSMFLYGNSKRLEVMLKEQRSLTVVKTNHFNANLSLCTHLRHVVV